MRTWLAGFVGVLLQVLPVASQETYGPFFVSPKIPDALVLFGQIDERSALEFRRALKANPNIRFLALNSPGGSVMAALLIADEVHERQLTTFIPAGSDCASACAFIYLAGLLRVAEGRLGVHQVYGGNPGMVATQLTISDIADALNRYGTPGDVLAIMLRTPPDQMHFFSPDEVARYGLNRTAIDPDAAATLPPPPTSDTLSSLSPEQKALTFLTEVLDAHAAATAATANTVTRYYAENLTYFGRPGTLRSVLNDKRAYFARWPHRTIRIKPETLRVRCYSDLCDIMGEYDWAVSGGSKRRAGVALFHYQFNMQEPLRIVTEGGQVLR